MTKLTPGKRSLLFRLHEAEKFRSHAAEGFPRGGVYIYGEPATLRIARECERDGLVSLHLRHRSSHRKASRFATLTDAGRALVASIELLAPDH